MKIKKIRKIKREEGPTRNQKWGILKYLSAKIFVRKVKDYSELNNVLAVS